MEKDWLQNIILKVLENSSYEMLSQERNKKNVLTIKLAHDNVEITVTPEQTFNVKAANNSANKELQEFIKNEIKPVVRKEALEVFQKGVEDWNKWRETNIKLSIDLSELELTDNNLSGINLENVDLSDSKFREINFENANLRTSVLNRSKLIKCNLKRANLEWVKGQLIEFTGSDLSYSKLKNAELNAAVLKNVKLEGVSFQSVKFNDANFTWADLRGVNLSGCSISEGTIFRNTKGIEIGINGVYSPETDSAGLYSSSPPGNSMKGPNVNAVVESLKRARKYFGFSFLLSVTAILIYYLDQDSTKLPFFTDLEINNLQYVNIAMTFSVGFLILSKSFIDDAFEGMKYLEDRSSVMTVGSFPWILTKYAGEKIDQIIISYASRIILCVHPLFYLVLLFSGRKLELLTIVLLLLLVILSGWILIFSNNFQKPILFDNYTEEQKEAEKEYRNTLAEFEKLNELLRTELGELKELLQENLKSNNGKNW